MQEVEYDMTQGWNSLATEVLYAGMQGGGSPKEIEFYKRRIRKNGGIALDQACGTGRHIFPLLSNGIEVHGADVSQDALGFARREAEKRKISLKVFHQRLEECNIPHKYGTIYIANGTFQILVDLDTAQNTLVLLFRHLSKNGQILIELFRR